MVFMTTTYPPPLNQLFELSIPEYCKPDGWMNYQELGVNQSHIQLLSELVTTRAFYEGDEDDPASYASVHAWRALGQLQAVDSVTSLLQVLDFDDDWAYDEIPEVLSMIGVSAIPALAKFVEEGVNNFYSQASVISGLTKIAETHPKFQEACFAPIVERLKKFQENERELNAHLIWAICDLKDTNHVDLIERAFRADQVDETVVGDFEDVQIILGMLKKRITPRPNYLAIKHPELAELVELAGLSNLGKEFLEDDEDDHSFSGRYESMPIVKPPKTNRNEPCPCGSGKKYKKCCISH